jgi:hypothetical protein
MIEGGRKERRNISEHLLTIALRTLLPSDLQIVTEVFTVAVDSSLSGLAIACALHRCILYQNFLRAATFVSITSERDCPFIV